MSQRILIVQDQEEFSKLVENNDFRIVEAIVDGALSNLNTLKRFVHILTVEVEEDDDIYNLTLDRKEFLGSLKKNLVHYENAELYEKCQEIVNAIKFLESKEKVKEHVKKSNSTGSKSTT